MDAARILATAEGEQARRRAYALTDASIAPPDDRPALLALEVAGLGALTRDEAIALAVACARLAADVAIGGADAGGVAAHQVLTAARRTILAISDPDEFRRMHG